MEKILKKYTEKLAILKENRAGTVDKNTDADNELYDLLIKQVANFIKDLKQLNILNVNDTVCSCIIPTGSWVCGKCGKPLPHVVSQKQTDNENKNKETSLYVVIPDHLRDWTGNSGNNLP